jgi:hypothetical protein
LRSCIIDRAPRKFDAESCTLLANMAEMALRELEKEHLLETQRQQSALLSKENLQLLRAIDCFRRAQRRLLLPAFW